jgi:hypothetical protein
LSPRRHAHITRASSAAPAYAIRLSNIDKRRCKRSFRNVHTPEISSQAYTAVGAIAVAD